MKVTHDQVIQLGQLFRRIFVLPISKLTIRELQNAIAQALTEETEEIKKELFDSFLAGELKKSLANKKNNAELISLIKEFDFHFKMAREVAELGEFMNSFSCDFAQQGKQIYFVNRMRRIDGEEYYFLSAPETNVRLAHMFITRLNDLKKAMNNTPLDPRFIAELNLLKKDIDSLLS